MLLWKEAELLDTQHVTVGLASLSLQVLAQDRQSEACRSHLMSCTAIEHFVRNTLQCVAIQFQSTLQQAVTCRPLCVTDSGQALTSKVDDKTYNVASKKGHGGGGPA